MKNTRILLISIFFSFLFTFCSQRNEPLTPTSPSEGFKVDTPISALICSGERFSVTSPLPGFTLYDSSVGITWDEWMPHPNAVGEIFWKYRIQIHQNGSSVVDTDVFENYYLANLNRNCHYYVTIIAYYGSGSGNQAYEYYNGTDFYIAPNSPSISASFYSNLWINISWSSVDGAVGYRVYRSGDIRGTLNEGVNELGNVTEVYDYPYYQPDFEYFVPASIDFAIYRIVAVNALGVESYPVQTAFGVYRNLGGF